MPISSFLESVPVMLGVAFLNLHNSNPSVHVYFVKLAVCRSPDGYSLIACSLDGTVATFHFDANELGHTLTDAELNDLKRNRYGDVKGRHGNLAESPAQLVLEAASMKQSASKKVNLVAPEKQPSLKLSTDSVLATKTNKTHANDGKKIEDAAIDGSNKGTCARMLSPVKQKEYRCPDGRRRIIPEAVGVIIQQERMPVDDQSESLEFSTKSLHHMKDDGGGPREVSIRKAAGRNADLRERSDVTARASISESLVIEKVPATGIDEGRTIVEEAGHVASGSLLSIRVFDKKEGEGSLPVRLEASIIEHSVNDIVGARSTFMKETELSCTRGTQNLWSDRISGKATVLAGNVNFWAVGSEDGCLQVSTIVVLTSQYHYIKLESFNGFTCCQSVACVY